MRIDWTPLIKNEGYTNQGNKVKDNYTLESLKIPRPKYWDKDNFITWILCGSKLNEELPENKA